LNNKEVYDIKIPELLEDCRKNLSVNRLPLQTMSAMYNLITMFYSYLEDTYADRGKK